MTVQELIEKLKQYDPNTVLALESRVNHGDEIGYVSYSVYKFDPKEITNVTVTEGFWPNTGWTTTHNANVVVLNPAYNR